ncbi:cob (mitochondrion) [Ooceraea biroi]|uniref:Cytochrome b n=1 Tax=Ooceraea biroi TaxID=2015173 RepID=A0A3L8D3S2_OOCBI|nr:cob [Ooceraea biroi]
MNKNFLTMIDKNLIKLPTPINISFWWNYGSLLGLFMMIQFITGFLLSIHYCPNINYAFHSIIHIMQNVNHGWIIHNMHINGASMFFICMYIHMGRGIYYHSFNLKYTWLMGNNIFIMSMATAFLGYVLPWGQMSFWGATVITNLLTTIPFLGSMITEWLWGGYSINNATLNRFFSFHFIMPFIIIVMIMIHLYFLHLSGSNNPLGLNSNFNKVPFHIYFTLKDLLGFIIILMLFNTINLLYPYIFSDPDNFTQANPMITPTHIQPEWYFLFAYAILRSIPNKLGGVLALLSSIFILYFLPETKSKMKSNSFYPLNQILFWMFMNNFIMLTFMGSQVIEYPYINISQILSMSYFMFFFMNYITLKSWDFILYKY